MSERVTQACLIQLDPTTAVGFLNLRWIPDVASKPPLPPLHSLISKEGHWSSLRLRGEGGVFVCVCVCDVPHVGENAAAPYAPTSPVRTGASG